MRPDAESMPKMRVFTYHPTSHSNSRTMLAKRWLRAKAGSVPGDQDQAVPCFSSCRGYSARDPGIKRFPPLSPSLSLPY